MVSGADAVPPVFPHTIESATPDSSRDQVQPLNVNFDALLNHILRYLSVRVTYPGSFSFLYA